ncbi:MAG: sensor histidine kinase [Bacteroidales bacterium]|nr:sensor histidine kinase [Bacteroidales bacterium]
MLNKLKQAFIYIAGIRIIQHFLFWLVSFRILLGIFGNSKDFLIIDYIYTSVFIFSISIPVYINLKLLIPKLLSIKKYILFIISFSFLLALSVFINHIIFSKLIDYVFPEYYFISYYELIDIAKFMIVFMALTSLLKLSKSWFLVAETKEKLSQLETEKYRTELMALRSQINPHFMFNSLNNIYSLTLSKSEKAPDAVIKLGNIMRYVIYDGSSESVALKDEIKILEEYIDLQNLRAKISKISFSFKVQNDEAKISPLIFLPIVENGYKHGIKGDVENSYLNIILNEADKVLTFKTENNKGIAEKIEKDQNNGIGIENVKRRLELIYPGNHEFHIFDEADRFVVEIKIRYE